MCFVPLLSFSIDEGWERREVFLLENANVSFPCHLCIEHNFFVQLRGLAQWSLFLPFFWMIVNSPNLVIDTNMYFCTSKQTKCLSWPSINFNKPVWHLQHRTYGTVHKLVEETIHIEHLFDPLRESQNWSSLSHIQPICHVLIQSRA